ncbi:MAG: hypothetical protein GY877_05825, partial [Hyphomicrobium sp.]|nr:hypothetical protein [Hyphomicrobium sp.]
MNADYASLTLTVSVDPQVYSAVGDELTYTYEVSSPVTLTDVTITGSRGEPCTIDTLTPDQAVTCDVTDAVTQADIDAGTITNTAQAQGTTPDGTPITSNEASVNADYAGNTGALTIRNFISNGTPVPDFKYEVTRNNELVWTLSLNGDASASANLPLDQYVIRLVSIPQGWTLLDVSGSNCGDLSPDDSVTIELTTAGVTCAFTSQTAYDTAMAEETRRFIHRRVDNLLSHGPDRARLLRRLQTPGPRSSQGGLKFSGSKPGGSGPAIGGGARPLSSAPLSNSEVPLSAAGGSGRPLSHNGLRGTIKPDDLMSLRSVPDRDPPLDETGMPWVEVFPSSEQMRGDAFGAATGPTSTSTTLFSSLVSQLVPLGSGSTSFKFGTSLSEMRAKAAEAEARAQQKKLEAAGLSLSGASGLAALQVPRTGLDIWVEGQFSRYTDDLGGINRTGDFRILYLGADYVLAPGVLVGALVQVDDTKEDINGSVRTGEID